jgi:hypothetical protein
MSRVTDDAKGMNEPVDNNAPAKAKPEKKQYAPPVLIDWGTLGKLTQSVGWSGKNDGGRFGFNKTR